MKKIIKMLKYALYLLITVDERSRYLMAQQKGYDCYDSKNDMFGTTYYFNPNKPPKRRYLTFKEFMDT